MHEFTFPVTSGPSPRVESTAESLLTVCLLGPCLPSATSAPGKIHPRNILKPVRDNSPEIMSLDIPGQPRLPMVHADDSSPGCRGRKNVLVEQPGLSGVGRPKGWR